ncbi:MAG: class I SAM-dependent methyltransferase [Candidatus Bathyarchaeia archaeon]
MKRKKFDRKDYHGVIKSTRTYYDEYSEKYVEFYENWSKREGEFSDFKYREGYETVARVLMNTAASGEKVIDIGCGVGNWSALLAENDVHVTSVDNLPTMLRKVSQRCKQKEIESGISPVLSDGFFLPFKDGTFDGATLNWVLAHIPVAKNIHFVREVHRVVKRNGWLFISDSYWRGQEGGKEQIQIRETEGKKYEVYKYYYEPDELRQLLQKAFGEVELLQPLHYELICVARKTV